MSMAYQTFGQMKDEVANAFSDTTSSRKTKIGNAIARRYVQACLRYPWPTLIQIEDSFVSVAAGEKHFYGDEQIGKVIGAFPDQASLKLDPISIASYLRRHGRLDSLSSAGVSVSYTEVGTSGQKADIATAEKLFVQPGAADVSAATAFTVYLHGIASNGVEVNEEVPIAGAGVASQFTYSQLIAASSSGEHTDVIAVAGLTSSTIYALVIDGFRTAKYKKFRLGPEPSAATSITIAYKKNARPLVDDNQVPEIPISHALVQYGLAAMYRQVRKPGPIAQSEESLAEQMISEAFDSETVQGEQSPQAMPIERYRLLPGRR